MVMLQEKTAPNWIVAREAEGWAEEKRDRKRKREPGGGKMGKESHLKEKEVEERIERQAKGGETRAEKKRQEMEKRAKGRKESLGKE